MRLILKLFLSTLSVIIASYLIPGVYVRDLSIAFIVAIVLGILNMFLKPVLIFFTLPLTIVTLGLFSLVINFILILLAEYLIPDFEIETLFAAFLFSIVLSLINAFFSSAAKVKV